MTEASLTSEQLAAKALVAKIAEEHGRVPEAVYAKLSPEGRRNLEVAILENAGSPILKVAESLNKSKAKVVFELLQNAENCNYSKALARNEQPYVSFKEYPGKLVIEYNEDGFTEDDVKAICSVNKGRRTPIHGYIGQTGLGFKSVFTVASKAHIQSNGFSFTFSHDKGGSGLGMMSPKWEEPDEALGKGLTRITLFIPEHEDPAGPQRTLFSGPQTSIERQMVKYQLQQIQDPTLLFMSKLRRIDVSFFTKNGHLETETSYSKEGGLSPAVIRKVSTFGNMKGSAEKRYYISKHLINQVPPHENRTYQEGRLRTDATTQITLAFPMDERNEPCTKSQDIFSFFSLSSVGFKFLVQADFVDIDVTLARTINLTSARNKALFDGVIDAFCKAICEFSELPALQYRWMRWLPERTSLPADGVWTSIFSGLESRVKQLKIFKTLDDQQLGSLSTVRRFQTWWYDSNQDLLFKNSLPELCLAREYRAEDLDLLEKYGLRMATVNQCLDVLGADLSKDNHESCMKSASATQEWHSLAAKALLILYNASIRPDEMSKGVCLKKFRSLPLIPLSNNTWVSAESEPIFYPHCGENIAIPPDLGLQLVDHSAALNNDRRQLFDALGVKTAGVNSVRWSILKSQQPSKASPESLKSSFNHLRFLYLSQPQDDDQSLDYFVYDENLEKCYPWKDADRVHLPSTSSCGPGELQKPAETCPEGFPAKILHPMYMEDLPPGQEGPWTQWLEKKLSVRSRLGLVKGTPARLSDAYQYVHCHRRDLIFDMLRYYWPFDGLTIMSSEDVQAHFQRLSFPTKDGLSNFLEDTYMPFPELERIAAGYLSEHRFPFLWLSEPISVESYPQWSFLVDVFGVRGYDGVNFYLTILQQLASDELEIEDLSKIVNLYRMIETRCNESENREAAWNEVREAFEGDVLVLLPTDPIDWASPSDCLWAAPENMRSRIPLEHIYEEHFEEGGDLEFLQRFFKSTISVPDVSWNHYLDELRFWSFMETEGEGSWPDFDWVTEIYCKLYEEIEHLPATARAEIKKAFQEERLIYEGPETEDEFGGWSSVKYTFWTKNPDDDTDVFLEDLYPGLHGFFCKFLGVEEYTLKTAREKLKGLGKQEPPPSVTEVKDMIWTLNSLLQSSTVSPEESGDFSNSRILPITFPDGTVRLGTRHSRFIILDKKDLGDAFSSKVEYLDFETHEVKKLRAFIQWLGLNSKCVSSVVEKITLRPQGLRTPLRNLDRCIHNKAHAIFRIASHFNSSRIEDRGLDVYNMLRQSQVYEADEISSELRLPKSDYGTNEAVTQQANLHIHEEGHCLAIFVPRDPLRQSICYSLDLPRRLLEWLLPKGDSSKPKETNQQALRILSTILNARADIVDHILEEEGINEVSISNDGEDDGEDLYSAPTQSASAMTTAKQPSQLLLMDSSASTSFNIRAQAHPKRPSSLFENPLPTRPHQRPKTNLPPDSAYVPKPTASTASTNKRRIKVKLPPASAYAKKEEDKGKEEAKDDDTDEGIYEDEDGNRDEDEDSTVSTGAETSDSLPVIAKTEPEGSETSTPANDEAEDNHESEPLKETTEKAEG